MDITYSDFQMVGAAILKHDLKTEKFMFGLLHCKTFQVVQI